MSQKTLKEMKQMSVNRSAPYPDCTVKVKVVKVGHAAKFTTSSGEEMEILNFSVADGTDTIIATLNDSKRRRFIVEGKSLHLRNFVVRNSKLILTKSSKIMMCGPVDVPTQLTQQAVYLITPPSPKKKVMEIKSMPHKSVVTVVGKIVKDECIRTVKIGGVSGEEASIHTIRLQDDGQEINVSLWRDMSKVPLRIGQFVEVTQCVTGEWQGQAQLNSTRNTAITHVDTPEVTLTGTVEGLSIDLDSGSIDIAMKTLDGNYQDLSVETELMIRELNIKNMDSDEALENFLTEMLPFTITVTTKGTHVLTVTHEAVEDIRTE